MALNSGAHLHLIGIGGTGLSAIGRVLLESGFRVSGSDRQLSNLALQLRSAGAVIFEGHRAENISGADLVIRSSAVSDDNPEVVEARRLSIPVLKRADFLGELLASRVGIAIAGTHGKTTTTSMVAWMLTALDQDPSYIIGGIAHNLGANARAGGGKTFVIEADEYDRMFHGLRPTYAVITNVEHDHPDCYPTAQDFYQAFLTFGQSVKPDGALVICADDPGALRLAGELQNGPTPVLLYGLTGSTNDYTAAGVLPNNLGGFSFDVRLKDGSAPCSVQLQVPGVHNVLNALSALAVAHQLGLDLAKAAKALGEFQGSGRRFEVLGEACGVTLVDDYGHHPTEIRATLAAARARYPGAQIWAVWQPHTYSRTQTLFSAFSQAFGDADHIVVTEIYPSREQPPAGGYSSRLVASAIPQTDVTYAANLQAAVDILTTRLTPGSVVIVFSAGDADHANRKVYQFLKEKELANV